MHVMAYNFDAVVGVHAVALRTLHDDHYTANDTTQH